MITCSHCQNVFTAELLTQTVHAELDATNVYGSWFRVDVDGLWTAECTFCLSEVVLRYGKDYEREDDYVIVLPQK